MAPCLRLPRSILAVRSDPYRPLDRSAPSDPYLLEHHPPRLVRLHPLGLLDPLDLLVRLDPLVLLGLYHLLGLLVLYHLLHLLALLALLDPWPRSGLYLRLVRSDLLDRSPRYLPYHRFGRKSRSHHSHFQTEMMRMNRHSKR